MKDRTPDSGIDNTILGVDALDRLFKYDALYRLLEATGREANNTPAASGYDDPGKYINPPTMGGTPNAYQTRVYKQKYTYDKMGRMVKTVQLGVNGWTRNYTYISGKNRLEDVRDGSNDLLSEFTWDVNGNMTGNNSERHYRYDHADRMIAYYNKPPVGDATKYAAYFYDGSGARTIKFIWTPGTGWECVTYVDGIFEYHHNHTSSTDEYKNYIQVDGGIEVRVGAYSDDTEPAVIYNSSDHLSSISFRLDTDGDIIDREEYYPYGETSLRTFEQKRYRYTGKEKDAESGLYYYGARYYIPWLASFTSTDPASGITFYQSSYNYADCNPMVMNDPTGMQSDKGGSSNDKESKGGSNETMETDSDGHVIENILHEIIINDSKVVHNLPSTSGKGTDVGQSDFGGKVSGSNPYVTPRSAGSTQTITYNTSRFTPESTPIPEGYYNSSLNLDMTNTPSIVKSLDGTRSRVTTYTTPNGAPRNSIHYWNEMLKAHSYMFDESNTAAITEGLAPKVNATWIEFNPQHMNFEGAKLVHHHIGRGNIATALPEIIHYKWTSILHDINTFIEQVDEIEITESIKQNKIPKLFGALDKATQILFIYGIFNSIMRISNSQNTTDAITKELFSWSGAIAIGELGAYLGSGFGPEGSFIMGLIGAILGGIFGEAAFNAAMSNFKNPPTYPKFGGFGGGRCGGGGAGGVW